MARFLLDYARDLDESYIDTKTNHNENEVIKFETIAVSFLKYYWHQICRFKIRQNFNIDKLPLIVQIIQSIFGKDYDPKGFQSVEVEKKLKAEKEITKSCFAEVIPRFQNTRKGNTTTSTDIFYVYDKNSISVRPLALQFFKFNYPFLYRAVILEWARFLEKINHGLPMLISKIESDEVRRSSLEVYYRILRKYFDRCFCCNDLLSPHRNEVGVDHFIPWSYIFEDEIWNLVLTCKRCNSTKSDSLYPFDCSQK